MTCLLPFVFAALTLLAAPSQAPAQSASVQEAEEQFKKLSAQAREDVAQYAKSGGVSGAENDPRRKWAAEFWSLRTKNQTSPIGGQAARESVRLLLEARQIEQAAARLESLPADDPAWRAGALALLREVAVQKADPAFFLRRVESLLGGATDPEFRARLHYSAGRFHLVRQLRMEAEKSLERAAAESGTEFGKRAARELHDLRNLNVGQGAPSFSATSLAGTQVSEQSLRGNATVFVYWASW